MLIIPPNAPGPQMELLREEIEPIASPQKPANALSSTQREQQMLPPSPNTESIANMNTVTLKHDLSHSPTSQIEPKRNKTNTNTDKEKIDYTPLNLKEKSNEDVASTIMSQMPNVKVMKVIQPIQN